MVFIRIAIVVVSVFGASVCYGQEFVECLDDSDCSRGPCVEGQCVSRGPDLPAEQGRSAGRGADWYRTKTEWFSLRFSFGNYGIGAGGGLFTIRQDHLFWDVIRLFGGGNAVWATEGKGKGYLQVGTAVGVPVHIGEEGKHEFRFSLGLLFGYALEQGWSGPDIGYVRITCEGYTCSAQEGELTMQKNSPVHLVPSASYIWRAASHFAFEIGLDLSIGLHNSEGDYAPPVFNGFIGFRI